MRSLSILIALTIPLGLALDRFGGQFGQPLVDLWVALLFGWMLWKQAGMQRGTMLACLAIATLGECVLALAWGLYDYRLGNPPLFVPPGHVLLFWLGVYLADRLPARLLASQVRMVRAGVFTRTMQRNTAGGRWWPSQIKLAQSSSAASCSQM